MFRLLLALALGYATWRMLQAREQTEPQALHARPQRRRRSLVDPDVPSEAG